MLKYERFAEEKGIFFEKKGFQLSKKHLCKSWKVENMQVVAGRPVQELEEMQIAKVAKQK